MKKEFAYRTETPWVMRSELIGGMIGAVLISLMSIFLLIVNLTAAESMGVGALVFVIFLLFLGGLSSFWRLQGYYRWKRLPLVLAEFDDENFFFYPSKEQVVTVAMTDMVHAELKIMPQSWTVKKWMDGFGDIQIKVQDQTVMLRYVSQSHQFADRLKALLRGRDLI